ncbi:RAD9, HUS1, RAD1-interacting nuclear orphan protein 1-like [Malaclemys terrapin pileata]|uniref:RAD9, HUS1, RAD1-interacting nuclear orphan protein 1-like n=1 Tax=Malaclemys terrapin pileata TaxID=2991368 RepID=UPI0023A9057A|nr:RAD9, HUS1, RAD1-interacting nuclear orphan protein 1-like [Malaclemys terrapin pileata]XP_053872313.1 RAD9, HUS1, RAD1-interacting nuclear orphan protein 1-like [Malaclemys terrapin pileata]
MPPKKKCIRQARKAQLRFLETPREGPTHHYGSPLPLAENPRHVSTKPLDQNASISWVSPQFESTVSTGFKRFQKHRHVAHSFQSRDDSRGFLHVGGVCRKRTVCKFPPLMFEAPQAHPYAGATGYSDSCDNPGNCAKTCHIQPKRGTAAKPSTSMGKPKSCRKGASQFPNQDAEPDVFSPPDLRTPELPSVRSYGCSGTLPQMNTLSPNPHSGLDLCADTTESLEPTSVLVKDTPEHEYGVKVTWRKRSHLMRYLREKGMLSPSDILVKTVRADPSQC